MILLISTLKARRKHATTLTLSWEKRTKSRLRVLLDNGAQAGLFLARGTILRGKDLLASEDGYIVQVLAADETLSIVTSEDRLGMTRACYHLGNRHTPLESTAHHICYPHDPVLDDMVKGLGLTAHTNQRPFEPEIGAYGGGGHAHD